VAAFAIRLVDDDQGSCTSLSNVTAHLTNQGGVACDALATLGVSACYAFGLALREAMPEWASQAF
jgi:hypothetical protein